MRDRHRSTLSAKLERNLTDYAIAAGAAGVTLLALVPASEARVVYTPRHRRFTAGDIVNFDINGDGVVDFKFFPITYCNGRGCSIPFYAGALGSGGFQIAPFTTNGIHFLAARKRNGKIGPERAFAAGSQLADGQTHYNSSLREFGPWADVKGRYLGLRLIVRGETHYGWARLNVHYSIVDSRVALKATLTGYAYETIHDKPILAGDEGTGGKGLGHLALGATKRK